MLGDDLGKQLFFQHVIMHIAHCKASSTGLLQSRQYRFAAKQLSLLQSHQTISSRTSKGLLLKSCAQKTSGKKKSKPVTFAVIGLPQEGACKLVATRVVVPCPNDICTTAESQQCFFLHPILHNCRKPQFFHKLSDRVGCHIGETQLISQHVCV